MIALLSRWKLRNGWSPKLSAALAELSAAIEDQEPGTLMFSVSLPGTHPPIGPPPDYSVSDDPEVIVPPEQTELVFFEVYRDAEAFRAHLLGPAAEFRRKSREFFKTPWQGHPRPEVTHLDPRSTFVRSALVGQLE